MAGNPLPGVDVEGGMMKSLYGEKHRAITQAELGPILANHQRYAMCNGGKRAVLAHVDLSGLNLAERNLTEADFSGAVMIGATLYSANLERASLYCTDLRDSNLQSAKLIRADMRGASLRGAKLAYAMLDGADLRAAMMMFVGDGDVSINRGSEEGGGGKQKSGPVGVDFSNSSLKNVSFGSAKLDGAKFDGAILQGANFRGAKMENVSFKGAVLTGVNLDDLSVPPEALAGCVMDVSAAAIAKVPELRARIEAHGHWIITNGAEGRPAVLDGEDLRPLKAQLTGRPLGGLSARNCIAVGIDFSGCQLQAANFEGADLRDANFTSADLRGITLRSTKLAHAVFDQANLCGLPFPGDRKKQPDLSGSDAGEDQFAAAMLDATLGAIGVCLIAEAA